jgi:hypothetical protein
MGKSVAILGATDNPLRYAYRALKTLEEHGHNPILLNPTKETIEGRKVYRSLRDIPEPVDTVTVYMRPEKWASLVDDIIALKPRRVILNPGTQDEDLARKLEDRGIDVIRGCTLVMLATGQF